MEIYDIAVGSIIYQYKMIITKSLKNPFYNVCFEFGFIWFYYPNCSFLFVFADFVLCQKISGLCFLFNWILFVSRMFNMKFYPFCAYCNNWYICFYLMSFAFILWLIFMVFFVIVSVFCYMDLCSLVCSSSMVCEFWL